MTDKQVSRIHLLAAEIFGYSFANYIDHLGIGHERFESLMPSDAETLETAVAEDWGTERVAKALDVENDVATRLIESTRKAIEVIDADNPAEAFRCAVRHAVQTAVDEGLNDDESIEGLVTQVCYRVSDLNYLLQRDCNDLSQYCRHLRAEPDVEYYDGYFDESG